MTTEKYLESLLDGSGHLNPFPFKSTDKSPDLGGYIKIDNKIYKISGWVKDKKGKISLKISELLNN